VGSPAPAETLRWLAAADDIRQGYASRAKSDNWAVWSKQNPYYSAMLVWGMKAAGNGDSLDQTPS
jgi:hypothetical protein